MTFRSILLAGIAVLMPGALAATASADGAAAQSNAGLFQPDQASFILTRTQWRSLADGGQIVVSRHYAVEILPCEDGYTVEGKLVGTTVDAPAVLEPLARIERSRADEGPFSLRLDQRGLIVPGSPNTHRSGQDQAVEHGRAMLNRSGLPAAARNDALAMVDRIMSAASTASAWPRDLFNPASHQSSERHSLPLPGGEQGDVVVSTSVEGLRPGSLPAAVERTVVTRFAGSERRTRERWTMVPG